MVKIKPLLSGKCYNDADSLCNPIIFGPVLPASLPNMNLSDVGFFKGNLRSQTLFEVPPDCYCTKAKTTWRTASLLRKHAEPANFVYLMLILRRVRIIGSKRQAAFHSALFNNTPLVIRGTSNNKQLTIIKPKQTGINRNKYTFCTIKSLEPLKNSKTSCVP